MFEKIFEKINLLFPYNIKGNNNKICIIKNGKKINYKRKIEGLQINIIGHNNYIEIEMPIKFQNSKIKIKGNKSKFVIKNSKTNVIGVDFQLQTHSEIYIDEDSRLNMGKGTILVGNNRINHPHKLVLGKSVQVGTEVYIRTSDGHSIFNLGEQFPYNEPQDIVIGDDCWIGARCTILKGSVLPAHTIVGACSVVNKKFSEENTIIAGHPAKVIKRNVCWKRRPYGRYMDTALGVVSDVDLPITKKIIFKKIKRKLTKLVKI